MTFGNDENDDNDKNHENPDRDKNTGASGQNTADEFDVDMTPEPALSGEAEVECLGHFESLEAFLRSQAELLLISDGMWLLDCIDYTRVQAFLEGDEFRIWRDDFGRVFRRRLAWPCEA